MTIMERTLVIIEELRTHGWLAYTPKSGTVSEQQIALLSNRLYPHIEAAVLEERAACVAIAAKGYATEAPPHAGDDRSACRAIEDHIKARGKCDHQ